MGSLSKDFLMQNVAFWVKDGTTTKTFFKFADVELPRTTYNQVGGNIISQRIDKIIETDWDLDFNIKDYILIDYDKYMITEIPPITRFNPLNKRDIVQMLRLIKIAN